MKKLLICLLTFTTVVAQAGPRGGGRDFNRFDHRDNRRTTVIHKHDNRSSGPDWLGPALIFGTAAVIIASSQQREEPREKVIIVKEPEYRTKDIWEKIKGDEAYTLTQAERKWKAACSDWKEELDQRYSRVDASCGVMTCVKDSKAYCYSSGRAEVSYRF